MSRYDALARLLLSTAVDWARNGDDARHLLACFTDLLDQELPDPTIVDRLAQVYTVDTDQAALVALVAEARQAVAR